MYTLNSKIEKKAIYLIFIIAFLSKILQFTMLPSKYFIDSIKVLELINGTGIVRGDSYLVTARFFRYINIFGFNSLLEWSIFITFVYNILFFIMVYKHKNFTLGDMIFIYASMALLDIFSFNLNKEVIQILIFIVVYSVINKRNITENSKLIIINIIFLLETMVFREYYILVLLAIDITYIIFKSNKNSSVIWVIVKIFTIFLAIVCLSKYVVPDYYVQIMRIREINEHNLAEANTLIKNIFTGKSEGIYCLNYITNFVRILFPIELISKGAKQVIFLMYQISITKIIVESLIKVVREQRQNLYLALAVIIGYFIASTAFEPDFGSVVRHETTLFIIFLYLKKKGAQNK